jgi:sporulation protein YlmC with PRC-barrel domain
MSFLDRDKYGMYKDTGKKGPGPELMGADTLLGENVVNNQDEDLGEIKEIMIDMRNGEIAYAVLSFGGVLGMGEKLFAVPWQALDLDTVNKRFVLDVDKERLKTAPGFDKDAWPDMGDIAYIEEIHTFYGTDPTLSGSMRQNIPMDGMTGGAMRGAGASSMGAGHAGSAGMGSASDLGGAGTSGVSGLGGGSAGSSSSGLGGGAAGTSGTSGTSGSSGLGGGAAGSSGASSGSSTSDAGISSGAGTGTSSGMNSGSAAGTSGRSGPDSGPGSSGSSGVSGQPTKGGSGRS